VCYCVLSVRSSQTWQQQQRRVKKGRNSNILLASSWCDSLFDKEQRETFPLFYNYQLCALDIVSLHSCHLCCVNTSQLMFRQTSIEDSRILGSLALSCECVLVIHKHIWKSQWTTKGTSLCVLFIPKILGKNRLFIVTVWWDNKSHEHWKKKIWTKLDFGPVWVNTRTSVRKDSSCEMFVEIFLSKAQKKQKQREDRQCA